MALEARVPQPEQEQLEEQEQPQEQEQSEEQEQSQEQEPPEVRAAGVPAPRKLPPA